MKSMKSASAKMGKESAACAMKPKQHCGTLTHLAECRGIPRKSGAVPRQTAPGDVLTRTVRNYAVVR